ncbi:MAG: hypothetical protein NXI32_14465 [bacterium]|nr:hypothetical protein [bacterium]
MTKHYETPTVERRPAGALSRKDAAAYLSVSTRQLDNYASAGLIPRIKLPTVTGKKGVASKSVFRVADLDTFLASRLESSEAAE